MKFSGKLAKTFWHNLVCELKTCRYFAHFNFTHADFDGKTPLTQNLALKF